MAQRHAADASVAQLAEYKLPKFEVAGSSPAARFVGAVQGEMAERLKAAVCQTAMRDHPILRVRISPCPCREVLRGLATGSLAQVVRAPR